MDKLKLHSPDLTKANITKLAELFPNCVTEAKGEDGSIQRSIDFDQLRQELSDHVVEGPRERYHLDWPGKREAMLAANLPIAKTLRPYPKESVDFERTKHLFIEGDNLDVLKLLQETYLNKVKVIYIDPPYNTGNDFVYDDDFSESSIDYFERSNQTNELGERLVANTEANGRFHSDWLSMLYPRLKLSRNLLAQDGFIFISIDDNESARLKLVCDEVFGAENFVTCITWQKTLTRRNDATFVSSAHEYVLIYARNIGSAVMLRAEADEKQRATYTNRDDDPRGDWLAVPFHAPNIRPNLTYPITTPGGKVLMPPAGRCWSTTKDKFEDLVADNRIYFGKDGNGMAQRKKFWSEREEGMVAWTWWSYEYAGENREATRELKELFDDSNPFSAPKPTKLLRRLFSLVPAKDGDVFLDFFGGSATTADAIFQVNAEDGIRRQFVIVQIPEACAEGTVAADGGFATIADIGKERIRRAGLKSKDNAGLLEQKQDIGFRVLKVDTSNMKDVYYKPDVIKKDELFDHIENIKKDRKPEDLLFQVLLDWGVDLSFSIAKEKIDDKTFFFVDENGLAACFESGITEELVKKIAARKPLRVVFRDAGFSSDDVKINVEQIFKLLSPTTEVKAI